MLPILSRRDVRINLREPSDSCLFTQPSWGEAMVFTGNPAEHDRGSLRYAHRTILPTFRVSFSRWLYSLPGMDKQMKNFRAVNAPPRPKDFT